MIDHRGKRKGLQRMQAGLLSDLLNEIVQGYNRQADSPHKQRTEASHFFHALSPPLLLNSLQAG